MNRVVTLRVARMEKDKWIEKDHRIKLEGIQLVKKSDAKKRKTPKVYIDMEIDRTFNAARAAIDAITKETRKGAIHVRGREPKPWIETYDGAKATVHYDGKELAGETVDDVGALLGDHLLGRNDDPGRLVVTTIVSSRLLARIAAAHGAQHVTTLTGFKWIVRPGFADTARRFVFGYEEALGYACTDAVPDKDGITAALVVADLAAELASEGRTLVDRLHDLGRRHGIHRNAQRSLRLEAADALEAMGALMEGIRAEPPSIVAGRQVEAITDHLSHPDATMRTDALVYELADGGRVVVRPSGTEPKVKIYGEVVRACGPDPTESYREADEDLVDLLANAPVDLGLPDPEAAD